MRWPLRVDSFGHAISLRRSHGCGGAAEFRVSNGECFRGAVVLLVRGFCCSREKHAWLRLPCPKPLVRRGDFGDQIPNHLLIGSGSTTISRGADVRGMRIRSCRPLASCIPCMAFALSMRTDRESGSGAGGARIHGRIQHCGGLEWKLERFEPPRVAGPPRHTRRRATLLSCGNHGSVLAAGRVRGETLASHPKCLVDLPLSKIVVARSSRCGRPGFQCAQARACHAPRDKSHVARSCHPSIPHPSGGGGAEGRRPHSVARIRVRQARA